VVFSYVINFCTESIRWKKKVSNKKEPLQKESMCTLVMTQKKLRKEYYLKVIKKITINKVALLESLKPRE
jgi:hypothetical protein